MDDYIGLDVSLKETAISVRRDGRRVWRGKCASDPKVVSQVIREHAPNVKRVVFETGPPRSRAAFARPKAFCSRPP